MTKGRIRIGTSGWSYGHWLGTFYPKGTRQQDLLAVYAERFESVEINRTFYKLPAAGTMAAWRAKAPAGFLFAAKASRYLTHRKKLKAPEEPVARLLGCVEHAGREAGAGAVPAAAALARQPGPPGAPSRGVAGPASLRVRIPRPLLARRADLRAAVAPGRRLLHLRPRRQALADRGDGGLRLHPPARAGCRLPGQLRWPNPVRLGAPHPGLERGRQGRLLLLRQRREGLRPTRRAALEEDGRAL